MSSVDELIKRIQAERDSVSEELYSTEGLLRLQATMASYSGEDKLQWSTEIAKDLENNPPPTGFMTGIQKLDALTGGFRQKQVITIFAHTKHGKTESAMWFMSLFPDLAPVLIPLEQGVEELLSQRIERGYSIPRFVAPRRSDAFVSPEWIEERIVEGIAKFDSKMVVIDHLGYIDTYGKNSKENLAFRIGQVMKQIRHYALKWNVCVILLSHISEGDEGKPPVLQDLANSSDIKKESDTVISIWRKNSLKKKIRVYDNKTLLSVLANRRFGRNGNVGLSFDTDTGNFYEDSEWVDAMVTSAKNAAAQDDEFPD